MKQKIVTFFKWFLIYGVLWGLMRFYIDDVTLIHAIKAGVGFGVLMSLGDMFVLPLVFKKIKKQ